MKTNEKIGVWIDHSEARLIPYSINKKIPETVRCENCDGSRHGLRVGEKHAINKIRKRQEEFYRKVMSTVKDYPEVLLFGPTNAKLELFNLLSENPIHEKMKIVVKNSSKMTENEMYSYVKNHFKPIVFGSLK
jgi:hypothetical protein